MSNGRGCDIRSAHDVDRDMRQERERREREERRKDEVSYKKLRYLFKLIKTITVTFILTLSFLAIALPVKAEPIEYSVVDIDARTCNPTEPESMTVLPAGVLISGGRITPVSDRATELTILCPIPTLEGAFLNAMEVVYIDPDGGNEFFGITVSLYRSQDDQKYLDAIATFNSNDRESPEDPTELIKARTDFSHTFDFLNNSYHVRANLRRRDGSDYRSPVIRTIRLFQYII